MKVIARPFIPWVGNKEKLIPFIRQVFPPKLTQYMEPFGGSGAILLSMPPCSSRLDIYNDLDAELVNLFVCVKEKLLVLTRELKFLPIHARSLFELYRDFADYKEITMRNIREELEVLDDPACFTRAQAEELRPIILKRFELYDVKRAAAYYNCIRGSFSSTVTSFGVKAYDVERFLYLLPEASRRLKDVALENKNALTLIRERNRNGGLIYTDPPYYNAERLYRVSRRRGQIRFHIRLWKAISECDGYVVVSYNDCPFIRKLYQDFYILAFKRNNPLAQKRGAEYGELIITNYDPRPYLSHQLTLFDSQLGEWEMELVHIPQNPITIL